MKILSILTILITLFVNNLFASEIKESCLANITKIWSVEQISFEQKIYKGIFLKESDDFCQCLDKVFTPQPKILGISPYFLNPSDRFTQEDYCRHQHYKEGTFELSTMLAHKQLQEMVQERILDHYMKGIWVLASHKSIAKKFTCLEEKIHTKCLKTGSGGVSYNCILYTMSDGGKMSELDRQCPEFETMEYSSPLI